MKQTIGIVLIILALLLGYIGLVKLDDSTAAVKFLGIEFAAEDDGAKQTAYIFLALAAISLIGGIVSLRRS